MYQLFRDNLSDGEKRPISNEKDTLIECLQLAETLYWVFNSLQKEFPSQNYGVYQRTDDDWKRVAGIREDEQQVDG